MTASCSTGDRRGKGQLAVQTCECLDPHPPSHQARPPKSGESLSNPVMVRMDHGTSHQQWPSSFSHRSAHPLLHQAWSRGGSCKHWHTSRAAWGGLGKETRMLLLFPGSSISASSPRTSRGDPGPRSLLHSTHPGTRDGARANGRGAGGQYSCWCRGPAGI